MKQSGSAGPSAQARVDATQRSADAALSAAQARADAAQARAQEAQARVQEATARTMEAAARSLEGTPEGQAPAIAGTIQNTFPDVPVLPLALGSMGILFIGFPIAIAMARLLWRRATRPMPTASPLPPDVVQRLARIEQAVESIAIEVERISEGQRFTTKLLNEGAAKPIPVPVADALHIQQPR